MSDAATALLRRDTAPAGRTCWVLHRNREPGLKRVRDLQRDPLVMWQHRYHVGRTIGVRAVLPLALGSLWGDAVGGLLLAGFSRLVCQYHATFATNSIVHSLGSRPYDRSTSARDSFVTALFTFGEGYHNFHHRFQNDYRNEVRRWHAQAATRRRGNHRSGSPHGKR